MGDKHIQLKIHTGNGNFDELFPVTKAELVEFNGKKLSESLNDVTAQLAQTNANFDTAVNGITVDSEVLLTHNSATKNKTFTTLDSRLEEIEADNKLKANKKQEEWITPTLLNGYTAPTEAPIKYLKDHFGNLILMGRPVTTATSGSIAFALPVGYRPLTRLSIIVGENTPSSISIFKMVIDIDGSVRFYGAQGATISLSHNIPLGI